MEMISVRDLCRALGESVSQKTHDEVMDIINSCTKYDVNEEIFDALNILKRYFNAPED